MAKKRIAIISSDNGWGLSKDIRLMANVLNNNYFYAEYKHFEGNRTPPKYDLNIHEEIVSGKLLTNARLNVLSPHPEWTFPGWLAAEGRRARFIATLCKTKHAVPIFRNLGMRNVIFTGFTTDDINTGNTDKIPEFLHIAGNSRFKNAERLIEIWNNYPKLPKLHLYNVYENLTPRIKTKNITYHFGRKPIQEIIAAQNKYLYHIQPSMSEGFGHVMWEALVVGSILITIDAPPMNEIFSVKIPNPFAFNKHHLGTLYEFKEKDGYETILKVLNMTDKEKRGMCLQGRQTFLANDIRFRKEFYNIIKDIIHGKYQ